MSSFTEALERMLNFNEPVDSKTSWQENWKILIYDSFCRDMISTLFKVADLRRHGVTLHLHIDADRQQVQDVSGVYFVCPTTSNVVRIAKDCAAGLYDSCHLNFSSSISQACGNNTVHPASICFDSSTRARRSSTGSLRRLPSLTQRRV